MKKIISVILIILMMAGIVFIPTKSKANFEINKVNLYATSTYSNYLKYGNIGIVCDYVVYSKDGKEYPAYCLNKDLHGVNTSSGYEVNTEELLANVNVWRAVINGYPYKSLEELGCSTKEEAFLATKQAVYCMIYDREVTSYSAGIGDAGTRTYNALVQIVTNARNSNEVKQSSEIKVNDVTEKWEIDSIDNKYMSKVFTVHANAKINEFNVELEGLNIEGAKLVDESNNEKNLFNYGDNFKIIIPITNMKEEGNFNIKVNGKVATKPILYGYSADRSRQDYAITGNIYEDGSGSKTVYYTKNETKIIILKQDENGNNLPNVQFKLLDENKNVLYTELTTNEEGKIIIENLKPGKYYIEETRTVDGYVIYQEQIEANVALNESLTVTVTNSKEIIEIEKPEITENNVEVVVKLPKTGM